MKKVGNILNLQYYIRLSFAIAVMPNILQTTFSYIFLKFQDQDIMVGIKFKINEIAQVISRFNLESYHILIWGMQLNCGEHDFHMTRGIFTWNFEHQSLFPAMVKIKILFTKRALEKLTILLCLLFSVLLYYVKR